MSRFIMRVSSAARTLLTGADISYVGSAELGGTVDGIGLGYNPMSYRRVSGSTRLLMAAWASDTVTNLVEVHVGSLSATEPFPVWSTGTNYGDMHDGMKNVADGTGLPEAIAGLHWDAAAGKLYWLASPSYEASEPNQPSVGVSTWDGSGNPVGVGHYKVGTTLGFKAHNTGITPIPAWFANAYCGGRRLGLGFGGYQSIEGLGGVSLGPSLSAMANFNTGSYSHLGELSSSEFLRLVGYPNGGPDVCKRNPDYTTPTSGGCVSTNHNPSGGIGFWQWSDVLGQGGVWVDTGTKSALIYMVLMGHDNCTYGCPLPSQINAERGQNHWLFYDPDDLRQVAQGTLTPQDLVPAEETNIVYPRDPASFEPWGWFYGQMVVSVVWVPEESRLYVMRAEDAPLRTFLHVYSVS